MIKIDRLIFFCLTVLTTVSSCDLFSSKKDQAIARAYDQYLYAEDLQGIVPDNVQGNDSSCIVNSFIEQWQQGIVLQKKAEKNVNIDESHLQERLDNYRKSLIRFQYEQELIRQKLDT